IEGTPLHQAAPAPELLYQTGTALARMDRALAQAELPTAHRPVLWNIGCWPRLMGLAKYLPAGSVGFIDFGDGGWNPRLQDLAIATSHVVTDPGLALGGAEYLIAGYASVLPLSALEARLLAGMMKARQSALILVNYWRAELFPAEAEYIKKNVARAERGLSILAPLDGPSGEAAVLAAVALPSPEAPGRALHQTGRST
ncbi:MAG: hypothetical protein P8X69_13330, partial [Maritimibacter sp.]